MKDVLDELRADIAQLASAGHAAPFAGSAELALDVDGRKARATTHPAFWDPHDEPIANVDAILLREVVVHGDPATLAVLAHGNYKHPPCAYSSAAAVVELARAFASPLLGDADIAPALRRGLLAGDTAIHALSRVELAKKRREELHLPPTSLRGIGSAVVAAVVTREHAFVAHVGENRAFLLPREGAARSLVHPHLLVNEAHFRATADAEARQLVAGVVLHVLGSSTDPPRLDVTRTPLARTDRIVIGNASLTDVPPSEAPGDTLVARLIARMIEDHEYVPATAMVL